MFESLSGLFKKRPSSGPQTSPSADSADQSALDLWSTVQIDNRRVDVFDPAIDGDPAGCVLFLHGHGRVMLNDNSHFSDLFARHNLAAVCPDGGRSWWLDHICSDFHSSLTPHEWILQQLVPFIEQRWNVKPPSIALLGISMGGQGVLQLSYRNARRFPVVAAISPAIDFHVLHGQGLPLDDMFPTLEDARQETVVLNLHPLDWPRHQWVCCDPNDVEWFDGCARLGMKLSSSGILHERDFDTSGGGHSWDYFNRMAPAAVQHIVQGLASVRGE